MEPDTSSRSSVRRRRARRRALISVVARYLFIATPRWTLGASTRLIVPLGAPGSEILGYYTGSGSLMLGGLEVAFGPGAG